MAVADETEFSVYGGIVKNRVVVTGMGVVSPLGNSIEENWASLMAGKSGAGKLTRFDASSFPVKISAEVKNFDPENYLDKKDVKKFDGFVFFALAAAEEAMKKSGLDAYNYDKNRAGCCVGAGIGGFKTIEDTQEAYLAGGFRKVSPFFIPSAIINMANGLISIRYGLKGPNVSIVTACSTGTHSVGDAARIIERGDADIMVAGGSEAAITPLAVGGFANMRALSRRNEDPAKASRPFDKDRDGFLIGEGGGVLVLESLDHALKRGAKIYGEIAGYGMSADAFHITMPSENGDGAVRCMDMAIKDAGITPDKIDYINAHGTSTPPNDKIETTAIKKLFGEAAKNVKISSTKSMTGHLLGAAGSVESIYSIMAINEGIVPPTINIENQDPECDLDYTPWKPVKKDITYALSNSFGFGGTNASLVFKKYES